MIILGLNAFHADSAAALVRDGKLIAAVEEERFCRIKHWAGFPAQAVTYCMREAGVELPDIDHIALNQDSRANFWRKIGYLVTRRPDPKLVIERLRTRRARANVLDILRAQFPGQSLSAELHAVEHHMAHLASAFHVSPFSEAAVVSVDGFGDFSSAAWGVGAGRDISITNRVHFPHSLGIFYQALTQFLGFPHYGDEYKVMGLAPYGQPSFLKAMRNMVLLQPHGKFRLNLELFRHHRDEISYAWEGGAPEFEQLFSPDLEELLGPRRQPNDPIDQQHRDLARSAQAMYEEAFFHLLNTLQSNCGMTNLTLAGGCAMNSVANGKVRRSTQFRRLYVQAAAGDAGGALGAAFAVWHKLGGNRGFIMDHAYWGPSYDHGEIEGLLRSYQSELASADCSLEEVKDEASLCTRTASAIAEGQVVGWFQGRMEWGPRALGNRSILCDPRRSDMKAILNAKIKRRESFRPFAPSILEEFVPDWFEETDSVPFMMQVFQVREERRSTVPAVTHVDGSGRLQTVLERTSPRYYRLIDHFRRLTGVPMVLNTSFNENEPVVCRPQEALDCFLRTKMDILVLGDFLIIRSNR